MEGELRFINSSGKKNPLNTLESPTLNLNPTSPIYIVRVCVYTYKHTCIAFALKEGGEAMQQGPVTHAPLPISGLCIRKLRKHLKLKAPGPAPRPRP